MRSARLILALGAALTVSAIGAGCFIDNPNAAPSTTSTTSSGSGGAGGDGGVPDATSDAPPDALPMPTLCEKYGGYPTIAKVSSDLVGTLAADCRINGFFTSLTPEKLAHVGDCVTKQVAVLTKCPGIKYDVDSSGGDCRDMKSSHHGLSIRQGDFDAFMEDVKLTLKADGVEQADIDGMVKSLSFFQNEIVTNSAPGYAKSQCAMDGGAP